MPSVESRYNSTQKGTMYQHSYKTFKQSHSGHRNTKNHRKQSNKHFAQAKACSLKHHKLHKSQGKNAKARNKGHKAKTSSKARHKQKPRASHKAPSKARHKQKPKASHKAKTSHNSPRGPGLQRQAPHRRKGGRKAKHKIKRT